MSFKVVTKVKYYDGLDKRDYSHEEALDSIVPDALKRPDGTAPSYSEYKRFMAKAMIEPFTGPKDHFIALDHGGNGLEYTVIRRDDVISAHVEIVKTLDTA